MRDDFVESLKFEINGIFIQQKKIMEEIYNFKKRLECL
jgi:hypothetical protein